MLMNLPFVSLSISDFFFFGIDVAIIIFPILRINFSRSILIVKLSY